MSKGEERKTTYIVYLKQRTESGLRLPVKFEKHNSSGGAMMAFERFVLDNEGKHDMFVELQYFENGGKCITLQEKHL